MCVSTLEDDVYKRKKEVSYQVYNKTKEKSVMSRCMCSSTLYTERKRKIQAQVYLFLFCGSV